MFLKTDRTYIRPFVREDLDELCQLCTIPEAMRFIPPHFGMETKAQVTERLERYMQHYDAHNISFGYVSDLDGNFIGRAGFYFVPEVNQYEIGYSLLPAYWGQGLATEIADGLLDYAFSHLHLDTVCARTIAGNKNSEAVLYKNGFTFLGERAFSLNGHVCLWNYFERNNDDFSTSVVNEVYAEDWGLVS
jgi:[ribosomal protein S5]-alanine N-acetyltransferase